VDGGLFRCARNDGGEVFISGYEIHQGVTHFCDGAEKNFFCALTDSVSGQKKMDGAVNGNVFGTYVHGLFDEKDFQTLFLKTLAKKRNLNLEKFEKMENAPKNEGKMQTLKVFKESQYDLLAETMRNHIDMKKIYRIMGLTR
jgi:adenosylcobyric acid synthase